MSRGKWTRSRGEVFGMMFFLSLGLFKQGIGRAFFAYVHLDDGPEI